jgi:hypothetical protein
MLFLTTIVLLLLSFWAIFCCQITVNRTMDTWDLSLDAWKSPDSSVEKSRQSSRMHGKKSLMLPLHMCFTAYTLKTSFSYKLPVTPCHVNFKNCSLKSGRKEDRLQSILIHFLPCKENLQHFQCTTTLRLWLINCMFWVTYVALKFDNFDTGHLYNRCILKICTVIFRNIETFMKYSFSIRPVGELSGQTCLGEPETKN